jgi:hypothetical protein
MLMAIRSLKAYHANEEIDVQVRLYMPEQDDQAWICKYEIGWPTGEKRSVARGVDAIQAILLALYKIGIEIYTSDYHKAGQLIWLAKGRGYGFPVSKSVRDLLTGDDVGL